MGLFDISAKWTAVLGGVEGSGVLQGLWSKLALHADGLREFLLYRVNTAVLTAPQPTSLPYLRMPQYRRISLLLRPNLSHLFTRPSHHKPLILTQYS